MSNFRGRPQRATSYNRPFLRPQQSNFPPRPNNQNLHPQPFLAPMPQNRGYHGSYNSSNHSQNSQSSVFQQRGYPNQLQQQPQYPYNFQARPRIFPPQLNVPPPQAPMFYRPLHHSEFNPQPPLPLQPPRPLQPPPPPPPPSYPHPSSLIPPPPPEVSYPPPPPLSVATIDRSEENRIETKNQESKHQKLPYPPLPVNIKHTNPPASRRTETEEERRSRKKGEMEKLKQEEKRRQQLRGSQQKKQMLSSRATPVISATWTENRLKKPTTFITKFKFRNELPDPTAQPKLLTLKRDQDRFTRYQTTSLEKKYRNQPDLDLDIAPDLGIPLDLLDMSVYNPPKGVELNLDPEDEELLRDDDPVPTPSKSDGIKGKGRPSAQNVPWLVKTQYISPIMDGTKKSVKGNQVKEMRQGSESDERERKIQEIEASFEACKVKPVHSKNKKLQPVEILPLLPDFDRYNDEFVVASFDSDPTAYSKTYGKLDKSVRDACASKAIMKSCATKCSESANSDKFLAYMAPSPDELHKDIFDEKEEHSYSWVREYHWNAHGEDPADPETYLVSFADSEARYLPLPRKLKLTKKKAKERKLSGEAEHFPVPSEVIVRRRLTAAEKEPKGYQGSRSENADMGLPAEDVGRSSEAGYDPSK